MQVDSASAKKVSVISDFGNMCAVKIRDKQTEFFTQRRGVCQGCNLSLTLFNVYINELAVELDQCAAPGLSLLDREVKSLFYADDLVLLSPTEQGLQQQLDIVEKYCQNWALAVNMKKTNMEDRDVNKPVCSSLHKHTVFTTF